VAGLEPYQACRLGFYRGGLLERGASLEDAIVLCRADLLAQQRLHLVKPEDESNV
jgi:hypothetical protein